MLFALHYLVVRRLFGLVGGSGSEDLSKDVEILVLRHQLKVLRRQAGQPRLRRLDRVVLAAASRVLPRPAWSSFMLSPQTLLRGTGSWCGGSGPIEGSIAWGGRHSVLSRRVRWVPAARIDQASPRPFDSTPANERRTLIECAGPAPGKGNR
jgi:hypothetical protein